MYKVRIQLYIADDHGEDILTAFEATFQTIENCLTYITSMVSKGKIQAVRMVNING